MQQRIQEASLTFGQAVTVEPGADPSPAANAALRQGYQAADELVRTYWQQVFTDLNLCSRTAASPCDRKRLSNWQISRFRSWLNAPNVSGGLP